MREMADRLWRQHRLTGEMQMKKTDEGWRLEVHAEKQPPAKVLEQLKSQQVSFEIDF